MIRRWLIISSLYCLLAGSAVTAQIVAPYCGQLAAADCALMLDARQSLQDIQSITINRASMLSLDGYNESEMVFSISGTVAAVPLDFVHFDGLNADLTLALDVANAPESAPPLWADLPVHSQVQVRVVDGVLYVDADSFVPLLEDSSLHGWRHIALDRLVPPPPDSMPMPPSDNVFQPVVIGNDVNQLLEAFDSDVLDQFVTVTRTGDVFETRVDFAAMYAHPVFQETLRTRLQDRWRRYSPPREETISDDGLESLASEIAAIFPEPVALYSITVDPETRLARGIETWGMLDFPLMAEAGINGTRISEWTQASMSVAADFTDINAVDQLVIAPADSQPRPYEMLADIHLMYYLFPQLQAAAMTTP